MKVVESTGDGCSYSHSVAPIHFTARVYGSVKVERLGTEEKGREGKRREEKRKRRRRRKEKRKRRRRREEEEREGKRREEKRREGKRR